MATSYTSLLGLALPVTGELQGTWGDTVNNSITSLLDTAVAGTTTLSTDGDVTLTTTTGASNQARQAILLCSGARTAQRTITAPAQSKIYTVINATTGGFSVKVVGAGPTTGVTIAAGESALIAWNGSDFIKISNTGGAGTFTNLTVTGNLTVNSLTNTRVPYASTSGLLVDSANMTFNGTRLTVADLADSGLTAARVVYSTTGGALIDSANLTFDGTNLGVGTNAPANRLHVVTGSTYAATFNTTTTTASSTGISIGGFSTAAGGGGGSVGIRSYHTHQATTASEMAFEVNGSTEAMRILTSLGLAIGRTSVIGTGNRLAIQMAGTSASGYTAASNAALAIDAGTSTNCVLNLVGGGDIGVFRTNSSNAYDVGVGFGDNSTRALSFTTANSQRAVLNSSGIWGIRTTPNAWDTNIGLMDFRGNGGLSNDSNYFYVSNNIYYDGSNNRRKSANPVSLLALGGTSNVPLVLSYGATGAADSVIAFSEALRVNASGQLLVGGTSAVGRLGVWGDIAKITTTGIDGAFDNLIKYGTAPDLSSGTALANRWAGFDASTTAGAAVQNVLRARVYPGTTGNAAPVNVVDFRGDQTTRFYGRLFSSNTDTYGTTADALQFAGGAVTGRKIDLYSDSLVHMGLGVDIGGGPYELSAYFAAGPSSNGSFRIGAVSHANPGTWSEIARFRAGGGILVGTTGMNGGGAFQFRSDGEKFNLFSDNSSFGQFQMGSVTSGEVSMSFIPKTVSFGTNPTSSDGDNACWAFGYGTAGFGGMGFYNKGNGANVCTITRTSTSWAFASDARLKDIDGGIENALGKIDALRPVYFTWKNDSEKRRKVGLIAQDVLTVLPEAVEVPEKEIDDQGRQQYLSMSMPDIVPLLVAAIQELKAEFDAYKATHP